MNTSLLSISITTIGIATIGMGQGIGGNVGGLHRLADGLGDGVVDRGAGDLGDDVAVLDLNGDTLHLGVVHTVLGGDLAAGVLHSGNGRVGHSMGNRGNVGQRGKGGSMGITIVSAPVCLSISLSLSLVQQMASGHNGGNRSIAENVNNILADLLVLDLLSGHNLGGAHILSGGDARLGGQDLILDFAVGGGSSRQIGAGSSQQLGVSLSRGGSMPDSSQAENHKELKQRAGIVKNAKVS